MCVVFARIVRVIFATVMGVICARVVGMIFSGVVARFIGAVIVVVIFVRDSTTFDLARDPLAELLTLCIARLVPRRGHRRVDRIGTASSGLSDVYGFVEDALDVVEVVVQGRALTVLSLHVAAMTARTVRRHERRHEAFVGDGGVLGAGRARVFARKLLGLTAQAPHTTHAQKQPIGRRHTVEPSGPGPDAGCGGLSQGKQRGPKANGVRRAAVRVRYPVEAVQPRVQLQPALVKPPPMTVAGAPGTSPSDPLFEVYPLSLGDRSWSFLHTGAVVTMAQEQQYLSVETGRLPYGAMLWPACIALAHDLSFRAEQLRGKRVLELGAGTGVPGIVAASFGASVLQIDSSETALRLCELNVRRNGVEGNVHTQGALWETFHSDEPFDLILGADVLYATTLHDRLRELCDAYLAPRGTVLFADPFRAQSLPMLEAMERVGWKVSLAKWSISVESGTRSIAIYEAARG